MNRDEIEHMWKVASNDPNHDFNWHDPVVIRFAELVAQHQRDKDREQAVALLRQLHDSFSLESAELRIGKWAAQYEEKYKYGTPLLDAFTKEKP